MNETIHEHLSTHEMKILFLLIFSTFFLGCKDVHTDVALSTFESSECEKNINYKNQGVESQSIIDNGLLVKIYGVANCCSDFEPSFEAIDDKIYLGFKESGRICSCQCAYHFLYKITGIDDLISFKVSYSNPMVEIIEIEEILPDS